MEKQAIIFRDYSLTPVDLDPPAPPRRRARPHPWLDTAPCSRPTRSLWAVIRALTRQEDQP